MNNVNTIEYIIEEIGQFLDRILIFSDANAFSNSIIFYGIDIEDDTLFFNNINALKEVLNSVRGKSSIDPKVLINLIEAIKEGFNEFPSDLIHKLLIDYIQLHWPKIMDLCKILGLIERFKTEVHNDYTINTNNVHSLIESPIDYLKSRILLFFDKKKIYVTTNYINKLFTNSGLSSKIIYDDQYNVSISVALLNFIHEGTTYQIRLSLSPLLEFNPIKFFVTVFAKTPNAFKNELAIGDGIFRILLTYSSEELTFEINDQGIINNISNSVNYFIVKFEYEKNVYRNSFVDLDVFNISLDKINTYFHIRCEKSLLDAVVGVDVLNTTITLGTKSKDGFINTIIPDGQLKSTFNLKIEYSFRNGLRIGGASQLNFRIPSKINIGAISIESIVFTANIKQPLLSFGFILGFDLTTELCPIKIKIREIGIDTNFYSINLSSTEEFDFTSHFKSPIGVGLSISSSAITGAGNLDFDQTNQRYSGGLGLQFSEIGLSAFGLIITKLPNGAEGYALLINISATFNPAIQLGYGFTLNGVGGLIAANRSIDVEKLRGGIKNHTLDGILFPNPDTIVANAAKIIGDMEAVFPVKEGQYIIGPMVKIGWGANLLTADIGVFIEFPDPVRVLLLGQVKAALPKPDKPIVVINLDVIGVVDFAAAELTFQASLYDSKLLSFEICGDSAMLIGWGANPRFALAIGGFHPRFTPPSPASVFSGMKRMSINIGNAGAVQISCGGYMAITSNTLQFGARADLFVDADSVTVEGYIGFDALFIFSPFAFEVEIYAGVHLKYEGYSLFGLDLHFWLSGPNPWHARGTASIDLWLFSIDVGFDETWGDATPSTIAPVNPWPLLKAELENPDNWGTQLPSKRSMVEILRERKPADSTVKQDIVLHPFGILEVRQRVSPLSLEIKKIANAPVAVYNRFEIVGFAINDENVINYQLVKEHFAPGQYLELTHDEQFTKPAFDTWIAGIKSSPDLQVYFPEKDNKLIVESADLQYESAIYSESEGTSEYKPHAVAWANVKHLHWAQVARREVHRIDPLHRNSPTLRAKPISGIANITKLSKRPIASVREEQYCVIEVVADSQQTLNRGSYFKMEQLKKERQLLDQLENKPAAKHFIIPEYQAV